VIAAILTGRAGSDPLRLSWRLRYDQVAAVRAGLVARGYAPATSNRHLAALRGTLREAWRLGELTSDDYLRLSDVPSVRGTSPARGRALQADEVLALFRTVAGDATAAGARDWAALALLLVLGLRRAEVAALELADVDLAAGVVRVTGKGRRHREVPTGSAAPWLAGWLVRRGQAPGPFLLAVRRDQVMARGITTSTVYRAVVARAKAAGLSQVTPHDLRRTFASELLDERGDVLLVSSLLGHSKPETTRRYDRRGFAAARELHQRLQIPPLQATNQGHSRQGRKMVNFDLSSIERDATGRVPEVACIGVSATPSQRERRPGDLDDRPTEPPDSPSKTPGGDRGS